MGYHPGPLDGIAGAQTAAAVGAFQRNQQLTVDGLVGEATNNALVVALTQRITGPTLKNFGSDEFTCPCGCGLDVVWP